MFNSARYPPDNNDGVYKCFSTRNACKGLILT